MRSKFLFGNNKWEICHFFRKILIFIIDDISLWNKSFTLLTCLWVPPCAPLHRTPGRQDPQSPLPAEALCDWPAAPLGDQAFHSHSHQTCRELLPLKQGKKKNILRTIYDIKCKLMVSCAVMDLDCVVPVTNAEWWCPQETHITASPTFISLGSAANPSSPKPIWPTELSPHMKSLPSSTTHMHTRWRNQTTQIIMSTYAHLQFVPRPMEILNFLINCQCKNLLRQLSCCIQQKAFWLVCGHRRDAAGGRMSCCCSGPNRAAPPGFCQHHTHYPALKIHKNWIKAEKNILGTTVLSFQMICSSSYMWRQLCDLFHKLQA